MRPRALLTVLPLLALASACIGTTGSEIVSFDAYAAGPADLPADVAESGLTFTNSAGWSITLTRAKVHIGAVYLNRSVPISGGQDRACVYPGLYVAQVLKGRDVDALSATPQRFPERGTGTSDRALTGEVWLTGGRIDATVDGTTIADVAGTATRGAVSTRFEGTLTISTNRSVPNDDPARPGAHPLCKERIVGPIPTSVVPQNEGALVVRVNPRQWFVDVDFDQLAPVSPTSDRRFIPDDSASDPAYHLYIGLRAAVGVYTFEWQP